MKIRTIAALAILSIAPAIAGAQGHDMKGHDMKNMKHEASSGWKELDAFHTLLAATWHPVEKSGDLKPIQQKAAQLSAAATAWEASKAPKACETKAVRDGVPVVAKSAKSVADLVAKKAPDAEVKAALKALHDHFEHVEEGCKPKH